MDRRNYFPFDPRTFRFHLPGQSPRIPAEPRHDIPRMNIEHICMSDATAARRPNPRRYQGRRLHRFLTKFDGFDGTFVTQSSEENVLVTGI